MILTSTIQAALQAALVTAALAEKVMTHADADLGAALAHLRDNPRSLIVIVPAADAVSTDFLDGTNIALRSEIRSGFELLISGRQLDKRETGDPKTLALKDAVLELLLWNPLGTAGTLITIPSSCEPLALEFDDGKAREAWKLSLEVRQIVEL